MLLCVVNSEQYLVFLIRQCYYCGEEAQQWRMYSTWWVLYPTLGRSLCGALGCVVAVYSAR